MFNLFKKKKTQLERKEPTIAVNQQDAVIQKVIEEKKSEDPLIGLKLGAADLKNNLLKLAKDKNGVHIESAIGILGSLAGNYCLISGAVTQQTIEGKAERINRIGGADGNTYYMGDLINKPLLTDNLSVWSLIGGQAQQLGAQKLPDINEIVEYTAKSIGGTNFGIPRLEEKHKLKKLPVDYIKIYHPQLIKIMMKYTKNPTEFPILIGLALQSLMSDAKDVIDPAIAVKIAMECAVPMSKSDSSGMLRIT